MDRILAWTSVDLSELRKEIHELTKKDKQTAYRADMAKLKHQEVRDRLSQKLELLAALEGEQKKSNPSEHLEMSIKSPEAAVVKIKGEDGATDTSGLRIMSTHSESSFWKGHVSSSRKHKSCDMSRDRKHKRSKRSKYHNHSPIKTGATKCDDANRSAKNEERSKNRKIKEESGSEDDDDDILILEEIWTASPKQNK